MSRKERFEEFVASYQGACSRGELNMASEETTRAWINQMLAVFGWDVRNTNQVLQEVSLTKQERSTLNEIGSRNTRPDYTMVNGQVRLFFLDAKKSSVSIKEDANVAYQIRSYGWSIGAQYSVVTNMNELAIYDCTEMPHCTDNADYARSIYLRVNDYVENFEEINSFLGRKESISKRLQTRFVGGDSIDKNFSKLLSDARLRLAQAIIHATDGTVSISDLNLWTQIILNRILFIRVCEARGLEEEGLLKSFAENDFWTQFKSSSYLRFYEHYDGPLFARNMQIHDLNIDSKVFETLLFSLYYPSPYCFDVIPLKGISDIYDLFLGYHLEYNTDGNLANVLKPEFKKSNGAVTTPESLVRKTIESTITPEYLQSLNNAQILDLKILDPACGSGVFLVGVYDLLVNRIETNIAERSDGFLPASCLYNKDGRERLNLEGRKRIVTQCLNGVDINQECVEVAKLSLSLKIIDGYETMDFNNAGLCGSQILHGVGVNIRCGNSLVENDILDVVPEIRVNVEEIIATNAFDYQTEFTEVFARGGFDFVIGNPPYVEVKNYNVALPCMSKYIKNRYRSGKNGKIDLAIPFIERGIELLNDEGSLGYIVQKRFFKTEYGKGIRGVLSRGRLLRSIYDYQETDLFADRITYVAVIVCDKSKREDATFQYTNSEKGECISIHKSAITENPWSFDNPQANELRFRLARELGILQNVCYIRVGVQVLWDKAYHITVEHSDENYIYGRTSICGNLKVERGACRKLLCNECFIPLSKRPFTTAILFPYDVRDGIVQEIQFSEYERRYPLAARYLSENRIRIENNVQTVPDRDSSVDRSEYWHLYTRANNHSAVYKKLCVPMTAQYPQAAVVLQENVYCDNANMFFIQLPEITDEKLYAMSALINSTPFAYFARSIANPQQGGFYKFNKQFLIPVPFPCAEFQNFGEKMIRLAQTARKIEEVNTRILSSSSSASRLNPLLKRLWKEVDTLCCELYALTEDECRIIMSTPRMDHQYE